MVRTFLVQPLTLEEVVPAVGENLDTNQAAVWKRNASKVRDREAPLRTWSWRLCAFLGIDTGPLSGAGAPVAGAFVV